MKSMLSLCCLAVVGLWVSACGPSGGKGAPFSCAQFPTAPACQDVTTGDTTTTNPPGDTSGDTTEEDTSCTPECAGKVCGPNGCGGFCGSCTAAGTTCVEGACVEGECGAGGMTATGQFKVAQGITFDKVEIDVEHKMDVDAFEDGCLTSIVITLGSGFGCQLRVEANTATSPAGGLRITNMSFSADSQCPGFPDENEGQYDDFSRMKVLAVVPSITKVPDANAPSSCITANFDVKLEGVLVEQSTQKTLNVAASSIRVSGETSSTGSTTASCPCAASCTNKDCGDDGCGFTCGVCNENEDCEANQCVCVPDCFGKECGDDGCGGDTCGSCGEFETCDLGECIECTPNCTGKECGDNGCGGTCGECINGESCSGAGQCTCANLTCGGECCGAGDKCFQNECCDPQCSGKECGDDGCGGVCGTCTGLETCGGNGQCSCTPECPGVGECGPNGCGGSCGTCGIGSVCDTEQGLCVDDNPGECDQTGFEIVSGGSGLQTVGEFQVALVEGYSSTSANFDRIRFEIWRSVGGAWPVSGNQNYQLSGENYSNCAICVLISDGCNDTSDCNGATQYLLTDGILVLQDFTGVAGSEIGIGITAATFEEVTIDASGVSTPVPNGAGWCIEDVVGLVVTLQ